MVAFARLAGLADIFGEMPSEQAAAMLKAMDESRAGAVLGHMMAGSSTRAIEPSPIEPTVHLSVHWPVHWSNPLPRLKTVLTGYRFISHSQCWTVNVNHVYACA